MGRFSPKRLLDHASANVRDYYRTAAPVAKVGIDIAAPLLLGPAGIPIAGLADAGLSTIGAKDKKKAALRGFGEGVAVAGATYAVQQLLKPAPPAGSPTAPKREYNPFTGEYETPGATSQQNGQAQPGQANPSTVESLLTRAGLQALNPPTAMGVDNPNRAGVIDEPIFPGAPGNVAAAQVGSGIGGMSPMILIALAVGALLIFKKGK